MLYCFSTISICIFTDFTIWPFHLDKINVDERKQCVFDVKPLSVYDEIYDILELLNKNYGEIPLGIASRIANITAAYQLLVFFNISDWFRYKQIYPGKKIAHFFHLHYRSGVEFNDMLFFDDDARNLRDVQKLGVSTYQVIDGLTLNQLNQALQQFSTNYKSNAELTLR